MERTTTAGRDWFAGRFVSSLDVRGRDRVFRYFNGWVTNGPGAGPGHPFPPGEFVYTLEGNTWTEYDPGSVIVWTRRR